MSKIILVFFLLILALTSLACQENTAFCRQINHHTVCILKIKRSAKNYWEYRVSLKIDNQIKPLEIYNCREQYRITKDGEIIPFETKGIGRNICRVFKS